MTDSLHVYLDEEVKEVNPAFITNAIVVSSLFSPCLKMTIRFKDIKGVLSNKLKVGSPLTITLTDKKEVVTTLSFRIVSCSKCDAQMPSVLSTVEVNLISSWFYGLSGGEQAYFGTPSTVIDTILGEYNETLPKSIFECSNYPRVYYRMGKTLPQFISYVYGYGYKGAYPMFLHTAMNDSVIYRSWGDMLEAEPNYYVVQNGSHIKREHKDKVISPLSLTFDYDASNSNVVTEYDFLVDNFMGNGLVPPLRIGNSEIDNIGVSKYTLPNRKVFSWGTTPSDSVAISIRDAFESNVNTFTAKATFTGWEDKITVGDRVKLFSSEKADNTEGLIGEGNYILTSMKYTYSREDLIPRSIGTFVRAEKP